MAVRQALHQRFDAWAAPCYGRMVQCRLATAPVDQPGVCALAGREAVRCVHGVHVHGSKRRCVQGVHVQGSMRRCVHVHGSKRRCVHCAVLKRAGCACAWLKEADV